MLFESLLVFISLNLKKNPYISGIRVVDKWHWQIKAAIVSSALCWSKQTHVIFAVKLIFWLSW